MVMEMKSAAILGLVLIGCCCANQTENSKKFPQDFIFGASTSAYQIEGGWNADGKGESIWDNLTHTNPSVVKNGSNGDVADDSYHNYKRDVQMMRELGINAYRLSLSWSRILPNGRSDKINEAGVAFYNNYINEMLKYNITPIVTLYHWDLPQTLQDLGGFLNPLISDWFEEYARVAFNLFGDRVKQWITINEPRSVCLIAVYFAKDKATGGNGIGEYVCAKYTAIAHAKAYRVYEKEFKAKQKGQCGFTINADWNGPLTDSKEDQAAAKLKNQALWGLYCNAIYSQEGGFPKELSERVAQKSKAQGYNESRMPTFTDEEKALVKGTYDFVGINHYTATLVSATKYKTKNAVPSVDDDIDVGTYVPEDWPRSETDWLAQAPDSMYNTLISVKETFNFDPVFYIFENGWSTSPKAGLMDFDRVRYYRAAWTSLLKAMSAGVKVKGYLAWSLMDNFEWLEAYTKRFGLYEVNFDDPARPRTPRLSAFVYKHLINNRYIDYSFNPKNATMTNI